jgi:hypothetical protein
VRSRKPVSATSSSPRRGSTGGRICRGSSSRLPPGLPALVACCSSARTPASGSTRSRRGRPSRRVPVPALAVLKRRTFLRQVRVTLLQASVGEGWRQVLRTYRCRPSTSRGGRHHDQRRRDVGGRRASRRSRVPRRPPRPRERAAHERPGPAPKRPSGPVRLLGPTETPPASSPRGQQRAAFSPRPPRACSSQCRPPGRWRHHFVDARHGHNLRLVPSPALLGSAVTGPTADVASVVGAATPTRPWPQGGRCPVAASCNHLIDAHDGAVVFHCSAFPTAPPTATRCTGTDGNDDSRPSSVSVLPRRSGDVPLHAVPSADNRPLWPRGGRSSGQCPTTARPGPSEPEEAR